MKIIFSYNVDDLKKERKFNYDNFRFKIWIYAELFTY